jgi:hypothetical protein
VRFAALARFAEPAPDAAELARFAVVRFAVVRFADPAFAVGFFAERLPAERGDGFGAGDGAAALWAGAEALRSRPASALPAAAAAAPADITALPALTATSVPFSAAFLTGRGARSVIIAAPAIAVSATLPAVFIIRSGAFRTTPGARSATRRATSGATSAIFLATLGARSAAFLASSGAFAAAWVTADAAPSARSRARFPIPTSFVWSPRVWPIA